MVAKVIYIYIYIYIYLYAFGFSLFYAFTLFAYQLILQVSGRCLLVKIVIFVFFFGQVIKIVFVLGCKEKKNIYML